MRLVITEQMKRELKSFLIYYVDDLVNEYDYETEGLFSTGRAVCPLCGEKSFTVNCSQKHLGTPYFRYTYKCFRKLESCELNYEGDIFSLAKYFEDYSSFGELVYLLSKRFGLIDETLFTPAELWRERAILTDWHNTPNGKRIKSQRKHRGLKNGK